MSIYARVLKILHEQEIKADLRSALKWLAMLLLQGDALGLNTEEREEIRKAERGVAAAIRWLP